MHEHFRGVNLGGWLIIEKMVTPSLFLDSVNDEFSFMKLPNANERIEKHRQTFITESDFKWLHTHGVSLVRIPVGYWLFESADGFTSTIKYLDLAMAWASQHNIKVLIDLHGAVGSQNGKDHSGRIGKVAWFTNKVYREQTIQLLCRIAKKYGNNKALWGIELLNEPAIGRRYFTLLRFYRQAYTELRRILPEGKAIVYHDAFHAVALSGALRQREKHPVVMDSHWYAFVPFGHDRSRYLNILALYRKVLLRLIQLFQPVIIGEWSSTLPQRYFDELPEHERTELLRHNILMQQKAYEPAAGSIYWTYKAEGGGMWNYRSLVEQGIIKNNSKK